MIVTDMRVRYRPWIGSTWLPETLIHRQGYAAPRFVERVRLPTWDRVTVKCPGY